MDIKSTFKQAKYEPNTELKNKIWNKILLHNRRIVYFKLISFSFIGITSLIGFIPMFKILINDFTQSGFYEYFSLAFSNGGIFSIYWKEFALSLVESLPTMNIALLFVLLFIARINFSIL